MDASFRRNTGSHGASPRHRHCHTTNRLPGSVLGIVAFRNVSELGFRRTILVLLVISGASLALA